MNNEEKKYCLCENECIKCYDSTDIPMTIHIDKGFTGNARCKQAPYTAINLNKYELSIKILTLLI
jgi:hypothetical protein